MRVCCPHCDKVFAVYPVPTRQAIQHRRAGFVSLVAQCGVAALVFAALGPDRVLDVSDRMLGLFTPRIGMGLTAAMLGAPLLFFGLAVYDRMVPHFAPTVGGDSELPSGRGGAIPPLG